MSINSILKKEGITVLHELDTLTVNTIAINIASKLCLAFPEHNLSRADLFATFCRINMYIAKMNNDSSGAKYFYKNNSIYFNETLEIDHLSKLAVHECIHCIQEILDENGHLVRMGLSDGKTGLGINEATVQLMASEANMVNQSFEKYYNISFSTISPNYYPLECNLVNQIAYFTGTYPLYHSTLNSNDVFKNTFIAKSNEKTYNTIVENLDKLISMEADLNYFIDELQYDQRINNIKTLNTIINEKKRTITTLFFKTQNLIIKKLFTNEFNSIRDLEDLKNFKKRFYNFKDLIGSTDNYEFYNNFYRHMMENLENKEEYIKKFGDINLFENMDTGLIVVENTKNAFSFITALFKKVQKLFKANNLSEEINESDI
jgi:hypothetical protein